MAEPQFGRRQNLKRSRAVMEGSSSPAIEPASHQRPLFRSPSAGLGSSSMTELRGDDGAPQRRQHPPRPSMDARWPVVMGNTPSAATTQQRTVIDLTADGEGEDEDEVVMSEPTPVDARRPSATGRGAQRLPRFGRNIFDADVIELEGGFFEAATQESPEVQFVAARPRPPHLQPRHMHPSQSASSERPREPLLPPHIRHQMILTTPNLENIHEQFRQIEVEELEALNRAIAYRRREAAASPVFPRFPELDIQLDFGAVGFDFGVDNDHGPDGMAQPPYVAPPPAPEGFTRTPAQDDVLVCPNCGDELCQGETDQKRQVWVVKKCGHVYCGDCNHYKDWTNKKREKSKHEALPPAFSTCRADGCLEKITKKGMIQAYL